MAEQKIEWQPTGSALPEVRVHFAVVREAVLGASANVTQVTVTKPNVRQVNATQTSVPKPNVMREGAVLASAGPNRNQILRVLTRDLRLRANVAKIIMANIPSILPLSLAVDARVAKALLEKAGAVVDLGPLRGKAFPFDADFMKPWTGKPQDASKYRISKAFGSSIFGYSTPTESPVESPAEDVELAKVVAYEEEVLARVKATLSEPDEHLRFIRAKLKEALE